MKSAFEKAMEFAMDDAFEAIKASIEEKPYISKLEPVVTKYYQYKALEDIDYTYHGHDIHNGRVISLKKGELIDSTESKENVYAIIYKIKDKLEFVKNWEKIT